MHILNNNMLNYDMFTEQLERAWFVNLSFTIKSEKVIQVTGCRVHFKSISETVLDKDVVTGY